MEYAVGFILGVGVSMLIIQCVKWAFPVRAKWPVRLEDYQK